MQVREGGGLHMWIALWVQSTRVVMSRFAQCTMRSAWVSSTSVARCRCEFEQTFSPTMPLVNGPARESKQSICRVQEEEIV